MDAIKNVAIYEITRPEQLRDISDQELLNLHRRLHQIDAILREHGQAREYVTIHRHVWVVQEMRRRGFAHNPHDALDEASALLESAAPRPPAWLVQRLQQADDVILVPQYISLVGSAATSANPHDLDILVREDAAVMHEGWRESLFLLVRRLIDPEKQGLALHFLYNAQGPHLIPGQGYVPLYDLVLRPHRPVELVQGSELLTPLSPYVAQKPAMKGTTDFVSLDELWEQWAKDAVRAAPLLVSPKVDGFRLILGHAADGRRAWSEDMRRDWADALTVLLDELPTGVLVEGELCVAKNGRWLARPQLATFLAGGIDGEPYCFLYDLLVFDGHDIHDKPFQERLPLLESCASDHLIVLPQVAVATKEELERVGKAMSSWTWRWGGPPVEGIVVRRADMPYVFGSTNLYAKIKRVLELKVEVVAVHKKQHGWSFTGALRGPGDALTILGDTFVVNEKLADVGDTLNVTVEELVLGADGALSWGKPMPQGVDRSRPAYTVEQALNLARRYGVLKEYVVDAAPPGEDDDASPTRAEAALAHWETHWYEAMPLSGAELPYVLHAHVRGLREEEAQKILDGTWTLDQVIAETTHSLHFDLRLATDRGAFLWGITLFAGTMEENRTQLAVAALQHDPDVRLQSAPKQFMPPSWLNVGKPLPLVVPPAGVGSTSQAWSAFFVVDTGVWQLGFARQHAVELFLKGQLLHGRFMWQYADFGDRRAWLFTRPKDQRPYAATHDRDQVLAEVQERGQRYLVWPKDPDDLSKGHELIEVQRKARLLRSEPERRYTLAVAFPLNERDAYGDVITDPAELEAMAWDFLRRHRRVGLLHQPGTEGAGEVVESAIYRGPRWEINGEIVEPGDWLLGVVWRDDVWERIKNGEFTGYSIQGWGRRVPKRQAKGMVQ